MTHRDPYGHKEVKNADFKIWSFLDKNHGLTPWKKVDFWTKYETFPRNLPIESVCPKTSPEKIFRPPKGSGTKK